MNPKRVSKCIENDYNHYRDCQSIASLVKYPEVGVSGVLDMLATICTVEADLSIANKTSRDGGDWAKWAKRLEKLAESCEL